MTHLTKYEDSEFYDSHDQQVDTNNALFLLKLDNFPAETHNEIKAQYDKVKENPYRGREFLNGLDEKAEQLKYQNVFHSDLITIVNDEPRVDSRILAKQMGISHKNLIELIRRYHAELQGFGILPFETDKLSAGAGRPELYCKPNEKQVYSIMMLCRNTGTTVPIKMQVADEFARCRQAIESLKHVQIPDNPGEALVFAGNEIIRLQSVEVEVKLLRSTNKVISEKAEFFDDIMSDDNTIQMSSAAKQIGMSAVRINELQQEMNMIYPRGEGKRKHYLPFAKYTKGNFYRIVDVHWDCISKATGNPIAGTRRELRLLKKGLIEVFKKIREHYPEEYNPQKGDPLDLLLKE